VTTATVAFARGRRSGKLYILTDPQIHWSYHQELGSANAEGVRARNTALGSFGRHHSR